MAAAIRQHQPEVIISINFREFWGDHSWKHADHQAVGRRVLDAACDAANRWIFPELGPNWTGLRFAIFGGSTEPTHAVDVTDSIDACIASLRCHRIYLENLGPDAPDPDDMLRTCHLDLSGAAAGQMNCWMQLRSHYDAAMPARRRRPYLPVALPLLIGLVLMSLGCGEASSGNRAATEPASAATSELADQELSSPSTTVPEPTVSVEAEPTTPAISNDESTQASPQEFPTPSEERNGMDVFPASGKPERLQTVCFTTTPVEMPADWELITPADANQACDFAFQGKMADTWVIAGELWVTGPDHTFEDTVALQTEQLEAGTEPNVRILAILNSGPSGEPIEIYNRWEGSEPQPWVIIEHQSQRRKGIGIAYSIFVDAPQLEDGSNTALLMWALAPDQDSQEFLFRLVESMTTRLGAM